MKSKLWIILVVVLTVSLLLLMLGQLESRGAMLTKFCNWLANYGSLFGQTGILLMLFLSLMFCLGFFFALYALLKRRWKWGLVAGAIAMLTGLALSQPDRTAYLADYYSISEIRVRKAKRAESQIRQNPAFKDVHISYNYIGVQSTHLSIGGTVANNQDLKRLKELLNSNHSYVIHGSPHVSWNVDVETSLNRD